VAIFIWVASVQTIGATPAIWQKLNPQIDYVSEHWLDKDAYQKDFNTFSGGLTDDFINATHSPMTPVIVAVITAAPLYSSVWCPQPLGRMARISYYEPIRISAQVRRHESGGFHRFEYKVAADRE